MIKCRSLNSDKCCAEQENREGVRTLCFGGILLDTILNTVVRETQMDLSEGAMWKKEQ